MTTLLARVIAAYNEWAPPPNPSPVGIRHVIIHLAAELNAAGYRAAARHLLEQLDSKVVPLLPPGPGGAA